MFHLSGVDERVHTYDLTSSQSIMMFLCDGTSGVDERVHTYGLTCGQSIICFYMMGLGANFTMREVASSANSYANCHYDIYQDTFST